MLTAKPIANREFDVWSTELTRFWFDCVVFNEVEFHVEFEWQVFVLWSISLWRIFMIHTSTSKCGSCVTCDLWHMESKQYLIADALQCNIHCQNNKNKRIILIMFDCWWVYFLLSASSSIRHVLIRTVINSKNTMFSIYFYSWMCKLLFVCLLLFNF